MQIEKQVIQRALCFNMSVVIPAEGHPLKNNLSASKPQISQELNENMLWMTGIFGDLI